MSAYIEGFKNYNREGISGFRQGGDDGLYVEMYRHRWCKGIVVCFKPSTVFVMRDFDDISEITELELLFKNKVEINGTFTQEDKTWYALETFVTRGVTEF